MRRRRGHPGPGAGLPGQVRARRRRPQRSCCTHPRRLRTARPPRWTCGPPVPLARACADIVMGVCTRCGPGRRDIESESASTTCSNHRHGSPCDHIPSRVISTNGQSPVMQIVHATGSPTVAHVAACECETEGSVALVVQCGGPWMSRACTRVHTTQRGRQVS